MDPLQQFLFSGFHFVACIVPCVCVVPCVLHVRQCEWMNRGGATKDKGRWTHNSLALCLFSFFLYHYPAPLTLSVTFNYRAFTFLAFISVFCVFISSVYSFTVPPFCSCCLFFQKAQWSHCFSHYFYSHWGYKWTKSYSSSHQPIKEMPGACERRQQTHTQQAVPGTV